VTTAPSRETSRPTPDTRAPAHSRRGDSIFRRLSLGAGLLVIALLAGVAIFLVVEGLPALDAHGDAAYGKDSIWGLVGPLLFGTVLASVLAMLMVTPLAIGLALVISHYAPRRLAKPVGYLVDLLAAVPSVVFGLWGVTVLAPQMRPLFVWLEQNLGWIPLFDGPAAASGRTILTASVVLALMALPIVTSILREIFAQTPRMHEEAALALGATRWEMIRMAVFPYARSGIVAALLLGLGRALGETMAVAMVLSATGAIVSWDIISAENSNTIAAMIANSYANASGMKINVLIFAGLALFVVTFAVNFIGRWVATRGQVKG
jgi:phosphate transport system permease protein